MRSWTTMARPPRVPWAQGWTPRVHQPLVAAARMVLFLPLLGMLLGSLDCRHRSGAFVIALGDNIRTIDPIGSASVDAASERVRTLIFNSLVKKDDKFDYVGDLASDIKRSDDGLTFTFTIRDGIKFHDGRVLSSADAKYTIDTVLSSFVGSPAKPSSGVSSSQSSNAGPASMGGFAKAASFFDANKQPYVKGVTAPDARTLVITLNQPWVGL